MELARPGRRGRAAATVAAFAVLLFAPSVSGLLATGSPAGLAALPFESLAVLLVLVAVPWRPLRWAVAVLFGSFVVGVTALAALDLGFRFTVDRAFIAASDWRQVADAYGVLSDGVGPVSALILVALIVAVAAGGVAGMAWAALRASDEVRDRGRRGLAVLTTATVVWMTGAAIGAQVMPGVPLAAAPAIDTVTATAVRSIDAVREQALFERAQRSDPFRHIPSDRLLTALAGKDVVIAFIESYGQVAVQGTSFSEGVARVLREGDEQLARDGYSARSAFVTSPSFGGVSWLPHATLQSGLWVDSQLKYDQLTTTDRFTLSRAFGAAGWRTVSHVPSNHGPWPVGTSFYGYDALVDAGDVGYRGPSFGYARIPDQYTWQHFYDRELAEPHPPVMAEIDFVSSHTPWTPLPKLVPWSQLGDGSIFHAHAAEGVPAAEVWGDSREVQRLYGESIEYSLGAMLSFLQTYDPPGLVLIVVGDHQPARIVSGPDATAEVPISIIAKDPAVFDHIASWGWDAGIHPSPDAPAWRMDEFRDRFLRAFGPEDDR